MSTDSRNTLPETDVATNITLPYPSHSPKASASFLTLPFEIRKIIYEVLFKLDDSTCLYSHWEPSDTMLERYNVGLPSGSHPQILATCRRINEEAKNILYSCNTVNVMILEDGVSLRTTHNTWIKLHHSDSIEPIPHKAHLFEVFKVFFPGIHLRNEILPEQIFQLIANAKWFCQEVLRPCRCIRYLEIHLNADGIVPTRVNLIPDEEEGTMSPKNFVCEKCIHGLEDFRLGSIDDYMQYVLSGPLLDKTYSHHILDAFREVRRVEKAVATMGEGEIPKADLDVLCAMISQND